MLQAQRTLLFLLLLFCTECVEKVIYLYKDPQLPLQNFDLSGIPNKPIYVPINCNKYNCEMYKQNEYPCLIYWKGAGGAFERIIPATPSGLQQHFARKEKELLNPLRVWAESSTGFEAIPCVFVVNTLLYLLFTYICSPPESEEQQIKKHKASWDGKSRKE